MSAAESLLELASGRRAASAETEETVEFELAASAETGETVPFELECRRGPGKRVGWRRADGRARGLEPAASGCRFACLGLLNEAADGVTASSECARESAGTSSRDTGWRTTLLRRCECTAVKRNVQVTDAYSHSRWRPLEIVGWLHPPSDAAASRVSGRCVGG